MTDHRYGSACVGAVVRKPPGKESAEDDVVTMTRALWRFDRAMFAQRLVYSPWFSRHGSQALRCLDLARSVSDETHGVFPKLGVHRLCHPPAGHSRH